MVSKSESIYTFLFDFFVGIFEEMIGKMRIELPKLNEKSFRNVSLEVSFTNSLMLSLHKSVHPYKFVMKDKQKNNLSLY